MTDGDESECWLGEVDPGPRPVAVEEHDLLGRAAVVHLQWEGRGDPHGKQVSSGFAFQDEYTAERNRALFLPQKIGAAAIKTGGVGRGAFAGGVFGLGGVGLVVAFVPGVNVAAATAVLVIAGGAAGGAVGGSVADTVNHVAFDN